MAYKVPDLPRVDASAADETAPRRMDGPMERIGRPFTLFVQLCDQAVEDLRVQFFEILGRPADHGDDSRADVSKSNESDFQGLGHFPTSFSIVL